MTRLLLVLFLATSLLAPLSACGKKGDPKAPSDSAYPRTYPSPK